MDLVKARAVAGEGKAVTSDRLQVEESCGVPQGIDPAVGKPAVGEPKGEASGAFSCDVQCRACRQWARLEIGSLGTTFFGMYRRRSSPAVFFCWRHTPAILPAQLCLSRGAGFSACGPAFQRVQPAGRPAYSRVAHPPIDAERGLCQT